MRADVFDVLKRYALRLSKEQQQHLYLTLQNALNLNDAEKVLKELRETKFAEGFNCPHCASHEVVRYGQYKGRQRYKCKTCEKTFSYLTQTPLEMTHYPEKWISFIGCMIRGLSLRKSSPIVGVSWVTLFYWRHKILSSLKQMSIKNFEGIFEVDETYFLYSEKGKRGISKRKPRKRGGAAKLRGISREQVCVLVARDRNKNTISKVSCMGRINKRKIEDIIGPNVKEDNIICSDAWRSYSHFDKTKGIEHYSINSKDKEHKKGIYHIQNVNNYHSRLKKWIDRFNGVASKYLDNYLAYFKFLDTFSFEETTANMREMLIKACLYRVEETYDSLRLAEFLI